MQVSDDILGLKPYIPGKPIEETKREYGLNTVYKLASNENAIGVSPKVKQALIEAIDDLHRYPDASCYELKSKVSEVFNIPMNQISFGNGSNELIDLVIRIFCEKGDKILTSHAAFVAYRICAQAARVQTVFVDLDEDLKAAVEDILDAWSPEHKIVFIPNPNNPTGSYYSKDEVEQILHFFSEKDCLVVFDEAYVEFVRAVDYVSAAEYLNKYNNLIVMRTMSKVYGIAGLRLGFVLASAETIDLIDRVRNPFNVNSLAQVAAKVALEDTDYIKRGQEITWNGLDYFYENFDRMAIKYWSSQGNFVLFDCGKEAGPIVEELLKLGVIVRPVANYGYPNYIRLSVGLPEENEIAIKAIEKVLG